MTQTKTTFTGKESFSHYCNNWLAANNPSLKISSVTKYERDIEKHIKPFWGEKSLCEITSEEVESFTQMLLFERRLSPKTVRNILILFHSILIYIGKRTEEKIREPEIIYPKEGRKTIRVLNKREEEKLMMFLVKEPDRCKLGVYMALRTGMRIGEVCALRWRDISFEAATISICHTAQRIRNMDTKIHKKTSVSIGTPKSDSSYRTIPLMPDIETLCARFDPGDPECFLLTGTEQCMDPRKLQRRLKSYTTACEIDSVHFHTLRHTFATRCVEVGFDVKTLSEILGHSNIGITMNQYVHPDLDAKRENMSRLKTVMYV